MFRSPSVLDDFKSFFNVPVRFACTMELTSFLHLFVVARFFWSQPCSTSKTVAEAVIVCFLILFIRVAIIHLECISFAWRRTSKPKERSQAAASRSFATAHASNHVSLVGDGRFKLPILMLGMEDLLDGSLMMLGILRFWESLSSMFDCESNLPQ